MSVAVEGTQRTQRYERGASVESERHEEVDVLPSPTHAFASNDLLTLRSLLMKMSDNAVATGKARIEKNDVLAAKAIEDAFRARKEASEARSEDGGFFDGLFEAAKALTVDLVKLENITDPFGALEESLEKAGDATINSRQFWADVEKGALEVAKWGAVAGSVVLAVGSFGAAAPVAALAIVGAVMSCAAAADSSFGILEKCGVDRDTAMWIGVGLTVGGALCSGGSGVAQMLATDSTKVASAALRSAAIIADASAGAAGVAGGVAKIQVADFEHTAMLADADAADADATQVRVERTIQRVMDSIRETYRSCERGTQRVADAMKKHNATTVALMVRA
ncbi:MAG: hypothetical protein KF764_12465 [Labilithrix sp.]|nr:hypothetical protein [Labilithrix sp.]